MERSSSSFGVSVVKLYNARRPTELYLRFSERLHDTLGLLVKGQRFPVPFLSDAFSSPSTCAVTEQGVSIAGDGETVVCP